MRTLRDLLATWENWSTRETTRRALTNARTEEQREVMTAALEQGEKVDPLDALRANSELIRLLSGWQWQAVYDASCRGHTWAQIADALGVTVEQARTGYGEVIDRQERLPGRDADLYRAVL